MRRSCLDVIGDRVADDGLLQVVGALASACRTISKAVRTSALDGNLGTTANVNVQGEGQKPLDILANDLFLDALRGCSHIALALSEEVEDIIELRPPEAGTYVVTFDPLDGSSNLDVDLSVGTIFSVTRLDADAPADALQPGRRTICAGYAIYGPSTMLVIGCAGQVDGFTLDEAEDAFVLTHPEMRIPTQTSEFAINTSRQRHWDAPVSAYVSDCLAGAKGPRERDFNMRWTASMVADVHRILVRGGVFLYPADAENQRQGGKLRLMYEAIPMALIAETAGGAATDGRSPILDIVPKKLHQRVPVVIGSVEEVRRLAAAYS